MSSPNVPLYLAGLAVIAGVVFAIKELRLGELFVDACGVVVPVFLSFKAIESPDRDDDTQWLTYWILYGLVSLVDNVDGILTIIPFYHLIKAGFLMWLWLPTSFGALTLYNTFVRPFFKSHEAEIDNAAAQVEKAAGAKIKEAKAVAEKVSNQVQEQVASVSKRVTRSSAKRE